ncbi:MAG TPA: AraC family transcriptional regulator [Candidatus Saccharimonadales bacterium]|nr:AraC family transcriptional regulator [Candidatus Saccharimonadales bacterium]
MASSATFTDYFPTRSPLPQVLTYGRRPDGLALMMRADPRGELEVAGLPSVLVAIHVGPAARIACKRGGQRHAGTAVHGDIDIVPALVPSRWVMHDDHDTALILSLPTTLVNDVAEEYGYDPRRVEILNRFQERDPQIENICWALKTEMEADYPSGSLYVDSLAVSIASRLIHGHSSIARRAKERTGGLSGQKLKQVLSFIDENLAETISLPQIAAIAGISVSHLKPVFRASVGIPVHQYVIRRRIERAKTLLAQGKLPIAEIALASGFSHQSHLARHMRRLTGISPVELRQKIASLPISSQM